MSGTGKALAKKYAVILIALVAALALCSRAALALPAPLPPEELANRSDLVAEGRVAKVWPYQEWRAQLQAGGWGPAAAALAPTLPPTDAGLVRLLRNFPYQAGQAEIDGVDIAEVQVEKALKGKAAGTIFIPFVRYHFAPGRRLIGPWSERSYRAGEHLKLYLRQNAPFYESVWWNAVQDLGP